LIHDRHFTREQANELVERLAALFSELTESRARLTDAEARAALSDAAPGNGGGDPGRDVGEAFVSFRQALVELQEIGIVIRDLERGLVDFPAIRDGREVYLCWQRGEDEVAFWHELDTGFPGRRPLD
jgi:hypothetical protein